MFNFNDIVIRLQVYEMHPSYCFVFLVRGKVIVLVLIAFIYT